MATNKAITNDKVIKSQVPQHIGLVENDGYLEPYEDVIRGQHEYVVSKLNQYF